jgi:hypothetical protein
MTTPAPVDMRLAAKGQSEPRQGLLDQAALTLKLIATHHAALEADGGWSAEETRELKQARDDIDSEHAAAVEKRGTASAAALAQEAAIDKAKRFVRRLRNALPKAVRKNGKAAGVTMADFQAGHALARSAPVIVTFLSDISPASTSWTVRSSRRSSRSWRPTSSRRCSRVFRRPRPTTTRPWPAFPSTPCGSTRPRGASWS